MKRESANVERETKREMSREAPTALLVEGLLKPSNCGMKKRESANVKREGRGKTGRRTVEWVE